MRKSETIAWGLFLGTFAVLIDYMFIDGGIYSHPYDRCISKGFVNPEDIGECIWLLENQPALRN